MRYNKTGKSVLAVSDVIYDILSFLLLFLVEANGLLRVHFKSLDSHKIVRPDTKVGNEWLSTGLKIA